MGRRGVGDVLPSRLPLDASVPVHGPRGQVLLHLLGISLSLPPSLSLSLPQLEALGQPEVADVRRCLPSVQRVGGAGGISPCPFGMETIVFPSMVLEGKCSYTCSVLPALSLPPSLLLHPPLSLSLSLCAPGARHETLNPSGAVASTSHTCHVLREAACRVSVESHSGHPHGSVSPDDRSDFTRGCIPRGWLTSASITGRSYPLYYTLNGVIQSSESYCCHGYRATSLTRKRLPLGPYSRPMPRALRWSFGGAVSYERGTPVTGAGGRGRAAVLLRRVCGRGGIPGRACLL